MGRRLGILIFLALVVVAVFALAKARGPGASGSSEAPLPSAEEFLEGRVRVEVVNTGGVAGVAGTATEMLRDHGFDVVYYGNAGTYTADSSVVLDRTGGPETARAVADALGIQEVRTELDSTLLVDVTVRLGPEWSGPPSVAEGHIGPVAWWSPGRLLQRTRKEPLSGA